MSKWLNEIELEGSLVKLVPLRKEHRDELLKASADGELWKLWYTSVPSEKTIDNYIDVVLAEWEKDKALPFVVMDKKANKVIGATRFCNATPEHRRAEIG
ncbi:MAG: GNAT family N-acetyltransferase, partial [Cyclobacteriaceae bacterium]